MYIYIYTRFCSQLILELLSVESIRARQLCTNDSITGRDESLEISRPEIRALCISLSLSLFICTRLPTALLSPPFHFSFFPLFFSFFFPSFIYHCRPRLFVSLSLSPSFRRSSLPRLLFILQTSSTLLSRSRTAKGGWKLVGRAIVQNVDGRGGRGELVAVQAEAVKRRGYRLPASDLSYYLARSNGRSSVKRSVRVYRVVLSNRIEKSLGSL